MNHTAMIEAQDSELVELIHRHLHVQTPSVRLLRRDLKNLIIRRLQRRFDLLFEHCSFEVAMLSDGYMTYLH